MAPFPEIELHRDGVAHVPPATEDHTGAAVQFTVPGERPLRHCSCTVSKRKTCPHLLALAKAASGFQRHLGGPSWPDYFAATLWSKLADILHQGGPQPCDRTRVARVDESDATGVQVTTASGDELAVYLDTSPARIRFLERLGRAPEGFVDRAQLLGRLALYQLSDEERLFADAGLTTRRQERESSFWQRLAYHCVREHGASGYFTPAINRRGGDFTFTFHAPIGDSPARPIVRFVAPRARVEAALRLLADAFPDQLDLQIHPVPLKSLFLVTPETELDLAVRPVIETLQASGEKRFFSRKALKRFRYGNLVYVPELELLAEIERPGRDRRFQTPKRMSLERSQIPGFLVEHADAVASGHLVLDEPLRDLEIVRHFDRMEIDAETLERSWYWLSVRYKVGDRSISLADVLRAMGKGLPYLETEAGWLDLEAPTFNDLHELLHANTGRRSDPEAPTRAAGAGRDDPTNGLVDGDLVRLRARDILRLQSGTDQPAAVAGQAGTRPLVERLLTLTPATPYRQPKGLTSTLRPYQARGVDWLRWLWENRLAGLLCDDMGLGKTHQAMGLMTTMVEFDSVTAPFLVVCPTSVMDHWNAKIQLHAPGLEPIVYHGPDRYLPTIQGRPGKVLITSYGVLRRDAERLATVPFALVVLDEIQHIKNRATQAYQAASQLDAELTVGLTGTPVENQLTDLKTLFDLLVPGLLGSDERFKQRFGDPDAQPTAADLAPLRKLVSPFMLRRRKETVLDDLPPKVEDLYTCALSDDQVKLYRDAVDERAGPLVERLRNRDEPAPYIHIFALLDLLKQVCNHPALALKALDRAEDYRSGKWDLFRELLAQALDSEQKVVVFNPVLGHDRPHGASSRWSRCLVRNPDRRHHQPWCAGRAIQHQPQLSRLPGQPEGGRHRYRPRRRFRRDSLRSLVECRPRGPGDRSRSPHGSDPIRPGDQDGHRGHARGEDRRHHRPQARTARQRGRGRRPVAVQGLLARPAPGPLETGLTEAHSQGRRAVDRGDPDSLLRVEPEKRNQHLIQGRRPAHEADAMIELDEFHARAAREQSLSQPPGHFGAACGAIADATLFGPKRRRDSDLEVEATPPLDWFQASRQSVTSRGEHANRTTQ